MKALMTAFLLSVPLVSLGEEQVREARGLKEGPTRVEACHFAKLAAERRLIYLIGVTRSEAKCDCDQREDGQWVCEATILYIVGG